MKKMIGVFLILMIFMSWTSSLTGDKLSTNTGEEGIVGSEYSERIVNVKDDNSIINEELSHEDRNAINDLIREAQYQLTKHDKSGAFSGFNSRYNFGMNFNENGVSVLPYTASGSSLNISLSGFGYNGQVSSVTVKPRITVDKNRVEYAHSPQITEWYVNDEKGLEQGFTIQTPPESRVDKSLIIEMSLETSLVPKMIANGETIVFHDSSGERVLKYSGLVVIDSSGQKVPAWLSTTGTSKISILIDDAQAVYPITIDPVINTETSKITASDGEQFDGFGGSMAISGDTIVVSAKNDDIGANWDQGSAYIFQRNHGGADQWGEVKKLTASDGEERDAFGMFASICGDTVVIGAYADNVSGNNEQGSAYIFERNHGGADQWGEVKKLTASDGAASDQYGASVSISCDTIVIGSRNDDIGSNNDQGSAYVYERNHGGADQWGEVKKLTASDGEDGDGLGYSVSLSGDTVVVGAFGDDIGSNNWQGSAYIFERNQGGADQWGEVKKLTASDGASVDRFCRSLVIKGDTIVVGAYLDDEIENNQGSAYIFERNFGGADQWGEAKKLTASDAGDGDGFGSAVAICNDTIIVGAASDEIGGNDRQGSAYVFKRNLGGADQWGEEQKLIASDGTSWGSFGWSVSMNQNGILVGAVGGNALYTFFNRSYTWFEQFRPTASDGTMGDMFGTSVSVDGDTVVVGAYTDTVGGNANQGSAYVVKRNQDGADRWGEVKKITVSDGAAQDYFGVSVSISGDTLVIGAYHDNVSGNLSQGSAYIFERNQGGADQWGEVRKLIASDGATNDFFGYSVSISIDRIVIGAHGDNISGNNEQGSAYIFERNQGGADQWGEVKKLIASDGAAYDQFGTSVSISYSSVVVGAYRDDIGANVDQGSGYLYERNHGGADQWGEVKKLIASDGAAEKFFGFSVSISIDTVVIGAYGDNISGNNEQGSAYIFERNQGGADQWGEVQKLIASDGAANDFFGYSVSISIDTVVIGAYGDNISGNNEQGSAYIFERNQGGADQWGEVQKLTASDGAGGDEFGHSVSIDCNTIIVGAPRDYVGMSNNRGSAYVYNLLYIPNPVSDAGSDLTIENNTIVVFDGSGSWDSDGIDNYTWTFFDGILQTLYGVYPNYTFNAYGVYNVTLNVSDAEGNWNHDWVEINVSDITNPVADAGPDQMVDEDTIVTFDGSGSSDNVGIDNYTWTFDDGGFQTLYGIGPAYTFNTPGFYNLTLNVSDAAGNWDIDWVEINVSDITDPVADAGPDQAVDEDTIVTFDGSGSSDNVGIDNYTWTFDDGGLQTMYGIGTNYTFNTSGLYNITLNVSDDAGNWNIDWVEITVGDFTDPVADAGPDQIVDEDILVIFDGSGSWDNVGIDNYTWMFDDGGLQTLYGVGPTYTFNTPELYNITLNVSDAMGNYDLDWVEINVNDITDPVADAGPDQIVIEDILVIFDGSGSWDNTGINNYTWTFNDGGLQTLYGVGPTYTFNTPGFYNITLNVSDAAGNWNIDWVEINVSDITDPVADAGPDQTVDKDILVIFDGSGSWDNAGIDNYTWMFDDGGLQTLYGVYPNYTFNTYGIYNVTLNVSDAEGNWNIDWVEINVSDMTNPIANAGSDQIVDEDSIITFDGSGSSDNVGINNYTWTFDDGGLQTLYGVGPTYTFNTPGLYNVTLNVSDAAGNYNLDWVDINVIDITDPVADAGPDQMENEDSIVTFVGSGSTDNIGIVNYSWTFNDGGLQTLYGVNPTYTFNTPGLYNITLNVSDAAGNYDIDWIEINVNDITDPIADAGLDQIVDEDTIVTFNGSGSWDNVGIVNYSWTFNDGGLQTLYGIGTNHTFNTPGLYNITLNVSDAAGNYDLDWVEINVSDITDPVADAGPDQIENEDSIITFDGSGSWDNIGIDNYSWTFNDGGLQTLYGIGPTYRFNTPGLYNVTLNVSDAAGNYDLDWVEINVNDITDPIADAGPDQIENEDSIVTFDGSGSWDNIGIVNYSWTFNDGGLQTLYGESPIYTFNMPGQYNVTLNVSDAAGNWDIDWIEINVNDITDPVADAGHDQTVDEDSIITFDGSGSTDNIGIDNYSWTFNDGGVQILYGEGPSYTFNMPGLYNITLNVSDAEGNWHIDWVEINVNDITDPIADTGPDQTVDENSIVTLNGSGSSDNFGITNYTWIFNDGGLQTLFDIGPTYTFNIPGQYNVTLNVSDAAGNYDLDWIEISVSDITAPVGNAGADQIIYVDTLFTFDGSESADNVDIDNYTWIFNDGGLQTLYGVNPTYSFSSLGRYNITLNVSDTSGNWDLDLVVITVNTTDSNGGSDTNKTRDWISLSQYWWIFIILAFIIIVVIVGILRKKAHTFTGPLPDKGTEGEDLESKKAETLSSKEEAPPPPEEDDTIASEKIPPPPEEQVFSEEEAPPTPEGEEPTPPPL
jgi:PKD repeat protein